MTSAELYRSLAARFMTCARSEQDLELRSEWNFLAACYLRLAEQTERNDLTDVVYETPVRDNGEPDIR